MNKDQHDKIIEDLKLHLGGIIEDSIKKYVNGKIDKLTIICSEASEKSTVAAEVAYKVSLDSVKGIKELNEKIKPIVEIYTDLDGTKKTLKWVFMGLSFMIGFALSVKALFFSK